MKNKKEKKEKERKERKKKENFLRYQVRIPPDVAMDLKYFMERTNYSMNTAIIYALKETLKCEFEIHDWEKELAEKSGIFFLEV